MSEVDDYRGNLAVCWRMAAKSFDALEKRAWLDMAESWKLLIACSEAIPLGENIDVATRAWPRSLPWSEVGRLFIGLSTAISIARAREWLINVSFVFAKHFGRATALDFNAGPNAVSRTRLD